MHISRYSCNALSATRRNFTYCLLDSSSVELLTCRMKKTTHFVGAAGTYYVMSRLSYENIHASCTFGNAPNVDILVSSAGGSRLASIQVKTAAYARRTTGRGASKVLTYLDWPLKFKAATTPVESLFFVFVDLWSEHCQEINGHIKQWQPVVYIIPSVELTMLCAHWTEGYWRLELPVAEAAKYYERWDLIKAAVSEPAACMMKQSAQ